ncbi:coronin-6 [Metarhizium album ARSEF 1941]|uniref:Coronin n=1 Tax=Metarhizium album (strain ARSEF 1941) TaxID=1081103 RepID=A0A0B2WTU9_METAS|nr:coronin-6 [Metarhizium album ARSEF 1941]KHN99501.1 coronin-6 [Metarhizium album ARSEF 1941]
MAGRFVRASKYRHVFGKPTRKEFCYDNLHISRNAWDTNLVKVNPEYLSVNWDSSGGGAFAVIPLSERGKLPDQIPLFRGHTATVLDTDWNPFNDRVIASGSEDGKVFVWEVPRDFTLYTDAEEITDVSPVCKLAGHSRKVGQVLFNPAAENILASASGDFTIKIWDVDTGKAPLALKHSDIVQSLSWNASGTMLVTTSRDKKIRVWDVRQEKPVHEAAGHSGAKNSRAVWMGEHNRFATTGFSRMSERQIGLWEPGRPEPIGGFTMLDSISGVCMPFWGQSLAGLCVHSPGSMQRVKRLFPRVRLGHFINEVCSDGNIRYYEYENDKFEFLSEYKSPDPQRGIAFLPRRGINVHENEVMRAYKTVSDTYIEPISFTVPRRAETFQADIFPPAVGTKPAVGAQGWLGGKTGIPAKIDLESIYDGSAPKEVPSDYKPSTQPAPAPAPASPKKEEARQEDQKRAPVARGPPPSTNDQKASISNVANKFQDKQEDEEDDQDETSSFEEISQPTQRTAGRNDPKPLPVPVKTERPPTPEPAKLASSAKTPTPTASSTAAAARSSTPSAGVEASLDQIKQLLENQAKIINVQNDKLSLLVGEVESLKKKVNNSASQDQSERIRQLELELEEARS